METVERAVEVWADVRCPWCWVGHRRLLKAVDAAGYRGAVVRRAFLLEPEGPSRGRITVQEAALSDWAMTPTEWDRSRARIEHGGRSEGLEIHTGAAWIFDSRDAHRLLKLVDATDGLDAAAAWETVFDEHFRLNTNLGDRRQLTRIGGALGLDETAVGHMLESSAYVEAVADDDRRARLSGIASVPTVSVGERRLSGSRSVADLVALLADEPAVTT